jgi:peroxiredoxin
MNMFQATKNASLIAFLCCGLSCGPSEGPGVKSLESSHPLLGTQAPDFTLPILDGGELSLESLRGKTVLLDFWATWCAPCHFQIPVLNAIAKEYGDREVVVLGLSVDVEGREVVAPFVAEEGVQYTVLLADEELARAFGAPGFPYSMIIDPRGQIRSVHMGITGKDAYRKHLPK